MAYLPRYALEARADQFFRNNSDDLYAIIDADLSELQEALS